MKKCLGCGVTLQELDPKKPGFVKDLSQDYCQRCFRLTHYNDLTIDMKNAISRKDVIAEIPKLDGLFVLVVDIMNVEAALSRDILTALKDKPICLIVNKLDVLPFNTNFNKIDAYLNEIVKTRLKNMKIIDVILTQKHDQSFNDLFFETLDNNYFKQVNFVGNVNAGKSTIMNKLIGCNALTVSRFPSTTLAFNEVEVNGYKFVDTPGLVDDYSLIMQVGQEEVKKILIDRTVRPTIFQLYEPQSYFVEGLVRVDVYPKTNKANVIYYINPLLKIHRTKITNADYYYQRHQDEFELKMRNPHQYQFILDENCDIVINGLGIITAKDVTEIMITTNEKIDITIRKTVF